MTERDRGKIMSQLVQDDRPGEPKEEVEEGLSRFAVSDAWFDHRFFSLGLPFSIGADGSVGPALFFLPACFFEEL